MFCLGKFVFGVLCCVVGFGCGGVFVGLRNWLGFGWCVERVCGKGFFVVVFGVGCNGFVFGWVFVFVCWSCGIFFDFWCDFVWCVGRW